MRTPPRRERDETRVFKKMGDALPLHMMGVPADPNKPDGIQDVDLISASDKYPITNGSVRVVDPKVTRPGTSYDKNPGDRIVPRDNNKSGPMVREDVAAGNRKAHDAWVENTNKKAREKGKTKIVRVDSGN